MKPWNIPVSNVVDNSRGMKLGVGRDSDRAGALALRGKAAISKPEGFPVYGNPT